RRSLISGMAEGQFQYAGQGRTLCGGFLNRMMARALSLSETNAAMGKICAAPTAGSCGILPAVLVSLEEEWQLPRRKILEGLMIASGIGAVIVKNATVAGAEGGCQAECGVAAAMAAAAAVYLADGNPRQQAAAVSFALMNVMGLVCDPIAGLVQVPCAQRNASQAVNALLSADMALAGTACLIPADEAIEAMYRVGRQLPSELKETALGGIAVTETGKRIAKQILGQEQ
ncbi:MAG: L-serine ammonia-lyase, iron-sulfur-dependent, subunit alpha, partial [Clostridium sp.]|nr:L-serine ammonia-lyase, iron-sulfur-dependent, subunit alpha [Clostridium sp.]